MLTTDAGSIRALGDRIWMLEQLDPEAAAELHASAVSGDALGALATTLDRALAAARSRLPGA